MLTTVLHRFQKALAASGAPAATRLRPGLPASEADRLEARWRDLGTLYRWHDGVEPAEEILRPSQSSEICYVMPGLYFDGLWWMPARLSRERHTLRGLSDQEWLLMDGEYEHVTCAGAGEVVAWCPEDGLQMRFPSLESFFELAASAWEEGIFSWRTAIEEDFGGLFDCDHERLDYLISKRPDVLQHPWH